MLQGLENKKGIRKPQIDIGEAGFGWIIVPPNVSRSAYVLQCYRTNTVAINGGIGHSVFRNVKVDSDVMQRLTFPDDHTKFGSAVVWVKDNVSGYPVIVASITEGDNPNDVVENQWCVAKQIGERKVQIMMDANTSTLYVDVFGGKEQDANFNVRLTSNSKNSKFNLFCDGEAVITATKNVSLRSDNEITLRIDEQGESKTAVTLKKNGGMTYEDEFGNKVTIQNGKVTIDSNSVIVNNGTNGGVMNVTEFKKFAQAVLQDLVVAQSGGNVTSWMATGLVGIEDTKFKH